MNNLEALNRFRGQKGIYFLIDENKEPAYIGYSSNIYIRLLEHAVENKKKFKTIKSYDFTGVSDKEILIIEMYLICHFKPKYNKVVFDNFNYWFWSLPDKYTMTIEEIEDLISDIINKNE